MTFSDGFFSGTEAVCYCEACGCKSIMIEGSKEVLNVADSNARLRHGDPPQEYWLPEGWCSFALRRPPNSCDAAISYANWHVAFHPSNLAALRTILDHAALLMPGNLLGHQLDLDMQIGKYKIN